MLIIHIFSAHLDYFFIIEQIWPYFLYTILGDVFQIILITIIVINIASRGILGFISLI